MDIRYENKNKSEKHSKILKDIYSELHHCNPVESHLILLRQCSSDLDEQIHKAEKDLERQSNPGIQPKYYRELPTCPIPGFPAVPFSDPESPLNRSPKPEVNNGEYTTDELEEEQVIDSVEHFVKCVLIETGYSVTDLRKHDIEAVQELIDLTVRFLQCFVTFMRRNKNCPTFCNADDLWGLLETTLQEISFGGINGIYRFYVERIAKKHDILYKQCVEKFNRYENLRAELAGTVKVIQGAGYHVSSDSSSESLSSDKSNSTHESSDSEDKEANEIEDSSQPLWF